MTVWMGIVAWMRRLSMAEFLSMVIRDKENGISRTLFFDDRLDDVVDVMMDMFVYNGPFIHDNALFVGAFLFFFSGE